MHVTVIIKNKTIPTEAKTAVTKLDQMNFIWFFANAFRVHCEFIETIVYGDFMWIL